MAAVKSYYGEQPCQATYVDGRHCRNRAYYCCSGGQLCCGMHSKKRKRTRLPKNPDADNIKRARLKQMKSAADAAAALNRSRGRRGHVIVTKIRMMKPLEQKPGYTLVFPNYRQQNRQDGYGCAELSPKSLGPVHHCMPNLPPAKNIENFHQFAKVYALELKSLSIQQRHYFFRYRQKGYADSVPHRHKFDSKLLKKLGRNVNVPLFSIYYNAEGEERRYSYLESRYFYCKAYEQLAPHTTSFQQLQHWLKQGRNLQIVGYDGYPVKEDLMEHYMDASRPFGHELVLYTLLTTQHPSQYPWNVVYSRRREHYDGFAFSIFNH